MTTLREAAQQALEALEMSRRFVYADNRPQCDDAIDALRAALAQEQAGSWQDGVLEGHLRERERWLAQEQTEPVAWLQPKTVDAHSRPDLGYETCSKDDYGAFPVYRVPSRCPNCASLEAQNNELDRKLAELEKVNLSRCPQCGGPADNGHDRSIPPNPYLCTKCMAEPVDFVSLLREADEIVRGKPTWKRFIDGTPLSNDIAVWMTVFAQDVARRAAPPQRKAEPVAWKLWDEDPEGGGDWRYYDAKDFKEGIDPMKYFDGLVPLYTNPPQRKPLSLTDLQEALVLTNLIDRDAIDDSEEYDEGSTLAQIDELYRIIKE